MLALLAIGSDGLDFEEALRHDEVDGARIDEMAAQTGNNLPDGLDEGADGHGSNRSSWNRHNTSVTAQSRGGAERTG